MVIWAFNLNIVNYTHSYFEAMSWQRYLDVVKQKYNFNFDTLKKEQIEVIGSVLEKKDTLAILPTSFGKSLIFILITLLLDEVSLFGGNPVGL